MLKEATKLNLTIQVLGDVAVLRCSGRITAEDTENLRNAVLTPSDIHTVVLDLAEVSTVDAAGLGILASLRLWATETGTQLKLMNLAPLVEEVLEITNLKEQFEICSLSEMLDLLCRAIHQPRMAPPARRSESNLSARVCCA
ncbi:MAG TPA: STAS domain-containing protein [Terriglobales bacterium]|nr:STAS domain-containing protein [Terriglobales bacterium]